MSKIRLHLEILAGANKGKKVPVRKAPFWIGSGSECGLVLSQEPAASRRHAEIRYEKGRFFITDLGSKHGTIVDDKAIRERALRSGHVIKIGGTHLRFRAVRIGPDGKSSVMSAVSAKVAAPPPKEDGTTMIDMEKLLQQAGEGTALVDMSQIMGPDGAPEGGTAIVDMEQVMSGAADPAAAARKKKLIFIAGGVGGLVLLLVVVLALLPSEEQTGPPPVLGEFTVAVGSQHVELVSPSFQIVTNPPGIVEAVLEQDGSLLVAHGLAEGETLITLTPREGSPFSYKASAFVPPDPYTGYTSDQRLAMALDQLRTGDRAREGAETDPRKLAAAYEAYWQAYLLIKEVAFKPEETFAEIKKKFTDVQGIVEARQEGIVKEYDRAYKLGDWSAALAAIEDLLRLFPNPEDPMNQKYQSIKRVLLDQIQKNR